MGNNGYKVLPLAVKGGDHVFAALGRTELNEFLSVGGFVTFDTMTGNSVQQYCQGIDRGPLPLR